jgi:hypothetical protein
MRVILNQGVQLPTSRRCSEVVRKFISDEVKKWLDDGIIVPSEASFASQAVVVKAAGKDWRLCIDFREINALTKPNIYPLPNVKAMLRRVTGHRFYAKIDLKMGIYKSV